MTLFIESTDLNWPSYAPGDLICGVVRLHAKGDHELCESLYITLQGQMSVSIKRSDDGFINHQNNSHFSSQAFLIKKTILLASATDLQSTGNHCWPFCFKLPSFTDSSTGYDSAHPGHCFEAVSPWKGSVDAEYHPLPPSMKYFGHSGLVCTVDYMLAARLVRPPSSLALSRQNSCTTHHINVRSRNIGSGNSIRKKSQLIELDSIIRCSGTGLRSMLRPLFSQNQQTGSSVAGKLHFEVKLPTTFNLQDTAPISIKLYTAYTSNDLPIGEQVEVKKFSIHLAACTMVRVGNRQQTRATIMPLYEGRFILPLKPDIASSSNHDKISAEQLSSTRFLTVRDRDLEFQIGKAMRQALRKYEVVPEFASYNIFRAYSLQLTVRLRIGDQNITFTRDQIPVSVPMSPTLETYEQAPAYETIMASSWVANGFASQSLLGDESLTLLDTQSQNGGDSLPPYEGRRRVTA